MNDLHKEVKFETEICEHLAAHGSLYTDSVFSRHDRALALFPADVSAWHQATQANSWEILQKNHGPQAEDDDRLAFVNNVKTKMLESQILVQQAGNNSWEQFLNSFDLANELMNTIIDTFATHSTMSKQALDSEKVRGGLRDILLGPAQQHEALRARNESRLF